MRDDYDDEYENGGSRRGCLWLMFCGPGALSFWFTRMYPQNEADAISAHHRKDNVAAQFISTMAIYAAIAVMAVFWNMAFDSDGTANRETANITQNEPVSDASTEQREPSPSLDTDIQETVAAPGLDTSAQETAQSDRPNWRSHPSADEIAAAYPRRALRRGITGQVVLDCLVQLDGRLDCVVASEEPTDARFGEAALSLASKFQLEESSAQIGQRVKLPITFSLE